LPRRSRRRERLRRLLADLEELPERQRAVLVMRELSGLGFAQIGDALSTSAAVARQTLYEARLNLRRLEDGREMRCIEVTRELSDADGRVARRRDIRAHLRGCAECRAFHEDIATRRRELAALTPLPLAASAGLLQAILGAGGGTVAAGGTAGGLVGTLGAGGGKGIATSAIFKSAATVAVVGTIGLTAADRGGLVDLTPPGEDRAPSSQGTASPAAAAPDQTRVGRGEAGSSRRSAADAAVPQAAGSPAGGKPFEVGEPDPRRDRPYERDRDGRSDDGLPGRLGPSRRRRRSLHLERTGPAPRQRPLRLERTGPAGCRQPGSGNRRDAQTGARRPTSWSGRRARRFRRARAGGSLGAVAESNALPCPTRTARSPSQAGIRAGLFSSSGRSAAETLKLANHPSTQPSRTRDPNLTGTGGCRFRRRDDPRAPGPAGTSTSKEAG
jgi:hypothetical protein